MLKRPKASQPARGFDLHPVRYRIVSDRKVREGASGSRTHPPLAQALALRGGLVGNMAMAPAPATASEKTITKPAS